MMTGYEKSPDYGGKPLSRWFWLKVIVLALVLGGIVVLKVSL